jgi:transaldolase / glucose-6-phosphate isomerase
MKERFALGKYREAVDEAGAAAVRESWVDRIWAKNPSLWKDDPAHGKIIEGSLGWLTIARDMRPRVQEIQSFVESVRGMGFKTACLLGMGGSSLCPEVSAATFGTRTGYLELVVLDTTDPVSIITAENALDLPRTLFVVASKSGGTIESASLQKYFYEKLWEMKGEKAGENFIAITDPGSPLDRLAQDLAFLQIFRNPKDIGGRFSALSYFGLVPMVLIGVDLDAILDRALRTAENCRGADPSVNPGLRLGIALGVLARSGRDKVTLVLPPEIHTFGYWVEQLVAESTGKEGVGILPVEGEPLAASAVYQDDRVFVGITPAGKGEPAVDVQLRRLEGDGHPVLRLEIDDALDLGGEFFLWEFATAVAGAVLKINPFDQPNVRESKDNTQRLIRQYLDTGLFEVTKPLAMDGLLSLYCFPEMAAKILLSTGGAGKNGLRAALAAFFKLIRPHDYFALLAYLERSKENSRLLATIRLSLRDKLRAATTLGFGPRFLHSTGQLHKGGPNNGLFLQITAADADDLSIPGDGYSFGTLKKAQATGDLQSLEMHGRRALRLHIDGDIKEGLENLVSILQQL